VTLQEAPDDFFRNNRFFLAGACVAMVAFLLFHTPVLRQDLCPLLQSGSQSLKAGSPLCRTQIRKQLRKSSLHVLPVIFSPACASDGVVPAIADANPSKMAMKVVRIPSPQSLV
jgi:hypothetical protein